MKLQVTTTIAQKAHNNIKKIYTQFFVNGIFMHELTLNIIIPKPDLTFQLLFVIYILT